MNHRFVGFITRYPWWVLVCLMTVTVWLASETSRGLSLRVLLEEMLHRKAQRSVGAKIWRAVWWGQHDSNRRAKYEG